MARGRGGNLQRQEWDGNGYEEWAIRDDGARGFRGHARRRGRRSVGDRGGRGGRNRAMDALKGNIRSLLSLCEELQTLKNRVENFK